ncbi:hypothetical protein [Echinimonas agarilytica]|uniref:Iota-carrageenase n=1 Tax=Echinimonas agarilytica TaxID=1215918 RepID=A0AA41W6N9_9GAMM|nr:hypothetical protein [Echinimonas agarilytica]MCM2679932.1 hypothetical protein [Echinimonas agarilytica]
MQNTLHKKNTLNTSKSIRLAALLTAGVSLSITAPAFSDSIGNKGKYFTNKVTNSVISTIQNSGNCSTSSSASTPASCTAKIQNALLDASAANGVVVIKKGTYTLNRLKVPSNIRIEIEPDTVLKMNQNILFDFGKAGGNSPKIENVEITTTGSKTNATSNQRFIIDANSSQVFQDKRMIRVGYAENFSISRLHQKDNFSQTPNIFLVADDDGKAGVSNDPGGSNILRNVEFNDSFSRIPKKGYIVDVSGEDIATGYAVIQPFSGEDLYFKNISAKRGITIRIEPGSGLPTDRLNRAGPRKGAYRNIVMHNISNEGGFAAIFLKPHTKINENIEVRGTTKGTNTTFVIWVDSGTAPVWADTMDIGYTRGYFTNTKIKGTVRHIVNNTRFKSDITKAGTYFLPREGIRSTVSNPQNGNFQFYQLPRDGSGSRWLGQPIAPIAIASSFSENNVGNNKVQRSDNPSKMVSGGIEAPTSDAGIDLDEGSNNAKSKRYRKFGGRYNVQLLANVVADPDINYNLLGLQAGDVSQNDSVLYRGDAIEGTELNGGGIVRANEFIAK